MLTRRNAKKFFILITLLLLGDAHATLAQRGTPPGRVSGFTLFGDVQVRGDETTNSKTLTLDLLLYSRSGVLIDRQKASNGGRYRFLNVPAGDYDLVVEFEGAEVARTQVRLVGVATDFRQDLSLEWRPGPNASNTPKASTVSADDIYDRKPPNNVLFERAEDAFNKKDYEHALALLKQIVENDPQDYQAWTELGTIYFAQKNPTQAEASYLKAIGSRPAFFLALLNLGRLRLEQKDFAGAIAVLSDAVSTRPMSAAANYFLGEAYLQIKKGSAAVPYLNEAIRLDPKGMAEVHLRLAALYNAAGMKDKAAAEYEQFLKKKPDYSDRTKLEKYISDNKKP